MPAAAARQSVTCPTRGRVCSPPACLFVHLFFLSAKKDGLGQVGDEGGVERVGGSDPGDCGQGRRGYGLCARGRAEIPGVSSATHLLVCIPQSYAHMLMLHACPETRLCPSHARACARPPLSSPPSLACPRPRTRAGPRPCSYRILKGAGCSVEKITLGVALPPSVTVRYRARVCYRSSAKPSVLPCLSVRTHALPHTRAYGSKERVGCSLVLL